MSTKPPYDHLSTLPDGPIDERPMESDPGEGVLEPAIPPLSEPPVHQADAVPEEIVPGIVSRSPGKMLWLKLKKNRTAMLAMWVLALRYGLMLIAGFVAPYHYETQNADLSFHPPMMTSIRARVSG